MTKEAMKLALEALQTLHDENMDYLTRNKLGGENNQCMVFAREAITALREALAKPDFWEGYVPEPVKPAQCKYPKCSYPCTDLPDCRDAEQPAQQALDKKAENARELGLDYEPAQQEPVAFLDWYDNAHWGNEDFKDGCWRAWDAALEHTSPPAQRTWVSLTDEELSEIYNQADWDTVNGWEYEQAIEAKLKEKNT
jgi:hypothetical protein